MLQQTRVGKANKEYSPIQGSDEFNALAGELLFGPELYQTHKSQVFFVFHSQIGSLQSISGTGSLRLAADFLVRFVPDCPGIWIPDPTWGNHNQIFKIAGFKTVGQYRYYKPETRGLDFAGLLEDLASLKPRSVVLLHACAHNPTGVDPTHEQWHEIIGLPSV